MPPKKKANIVKEEVRLEVVEAQSEHGSEPAESESPAAQTPRDANTEVARSGAFYFAAGDIALCVKGSEDEPPPQSIIFRVDKAFLARHSTVLAAKFQAQAAADAGEAEQYDGVPMLTLEDKPEQFEDLLTFMYNPASLFRWLRDPKMDVATGIDDLLAVAEKYKVHGIKPFLLHTLERDWPPTLLEWLRVQGETSHLRDLWRARDADVSWDDLYPVDPAAAISIGLDHDMPTILPSAFYALSSIPFQDDWDRWRLDSDEDWRYNVSEDVGTENLFGGIRTARWSWLGKEPLMKLLLGKDVLLARRASLWRVYNLELVGGATRRDQCMAELGRLMKEYTADFAGSGPYEPLQALVRMLAKINTNGVLCMACRHAVRTNIDKEMVKLWDDLPHIFSLDKPEEDECK